MLYARRHGYTPGDSLLVPPTFGRIVAWLWEVSSTDEAAVLIADLMASLRIIEERADEGPPVRFADVLKSLRTALPSDSDADRLIQYLRDEAPGYYHGDDPDPADDLNA